jgi:hypothetical protein
MYQFNYRSNFNLLLVRGSTSRLLPRQVQPVKIDGAKRSLAPAGVYTQVPNAVTTLFSPDLPTKQPQENEL